MLQITFCYERKKCQSSVFKIKPKNYTAVGGNTIPFAICSNRKALLCFSWINPLLEEKNFKLWSWLDTISVCDIRRISRREMFHLQNFLSRPISYISNSKVTLWSNTWQLVSRRVHCVSQSITHNYKHVVTSWMWLFIHECNIVKMGDIWLVVVEHFLSEEGAKRRGYIRRGYTEYTIISDMLFILHPCVLWMIVCGWGLHAAKLYNHGTQHNRCCIFSYFRNCRLD